MQPQHVLISQYGAGFGMLRHAITASGDDFWYETRWHNPCWRVAYHVLFYTDLYLSVDETRFVPWDHHREDYQVLGDTIPWPPHRAVNIGEPYTRDQILVYCAKIRDTLASRVDPFDAEAPSGFSWLPFTKLELHLYNLRHLQHHTGQLIERLKETRHIAVSWIGTVS